MNHFASPHPSFSFPGSLSKKLHDLYRILFRTVERNRLTSVRISGVLKHYRAAGLLTRLTHVVYGIYQYCTIYYVRYSGVASKYVLIKHSKYRVATSSQPSMPACHIMHCASRFERSPFFFCLTRLTLT